jgi:hypothetical protein
MNKTQLILLIIQSALAGLGSLGGTTGTDTKLTAAFVGILQSALAMYQAETGQPLDLTKIPLEAKV